jgi:VWFA-related protein
VKSARAVFPFLLAVLGASAAGAEPPASAERTIDVFVVDEKNEPVAGLSAAEIAISSRGVARDVVSLERDTRPLHLVLLLDTSVPSASAYRLSVPEAVADLVRRMPPGTRFTVYGTGDRPEKLVENATDAGAVDRAVRRAVPRGGNRLLDAVVEASRDHKPKEGERTAILAVTGLGIGFSDYDRQQVVDRAREQGVTVHGLTYDEGRAPGSMESPDRVGGADYEFVVAELAKATGGTFERTLSAMGVRKALASIAAAVAAPYRLTYRVPAGQKDDKLELTVARPGVKARVGGR